VEPDGVGRGAPEEYQTIASTMQAGPVRPTESKSMSDAQLTRLEERQEALIRGVAQMNDTLGLLSTMLERILRAAAQPPPKSELGETLKRIAGLLAEHQEALATLEGRLADLPEKIARAHVASPLNGQGDTPP
jgi:hypothetical protein